MILDKEKNERYIPSAFSSLLYIIRLWKDGIILGYPDRVKETGTGRRSGAPPIGNL